MNENTLHRSKNALDLKASRQLNRRDRPGDEYMSTNALLEDGAERVDEDANSSEDHHEVTVDLISKLQESSYTIAHILALAAMLVVIWWINTLGGLSWKRGQAKLVFNWHPLLMVASFCFMTVASLSFRFSFLQQRLDRGRLKVVHGSAWLVAALCAVVALLAVFRSHNDAKSGFVANMYSFHSWIGAAVILLYALQFFVGLFSFAFPPRFVTPEIKATALLFHVFAGPLIYVLTATTILLGIQEKEGFIGCAYKVESADLFPFLNIRKIPLPCLVGHVLGFLVFSTAITTSFALHNFGSRYEQRRVN
uniref:Cytochrome b561 domain-containing protein n=1 Tax=Phaeodactylum tricornutum TaxID=2850 RepID=A0A8J9T782_PHATR